MYRALYLYCSFTINFSFIIILNKQTHYLFFVCRFQGMLLRLHNRGGRAMLLTTDEADDALNITENKTNSITDIFFLKYCLNLGLLYLPS